MAGEGPSRDDLASWLGIFHPAYRKYLAGLLGIGLVAGVLTYLNLEMLQSLVRTFAAIGELDTLGCAQAAQVHPVTGFLVCNGIASGWVVALLVLLIYASLELMQAALVVARIYVQGLLEIKSRNDIEREVLVNLLRKDDQFFQRQSATQITNRLAEDTTRMFERRDDISTLWSVSVQALGALAFLWAQNWSYAAAALVFSLAGVYIIHRMLGRMRFLDGARLQSDDDVKAAFEDYLQATPEAQMGGLSGKIARQLGVVQQQRQSAFMGLIGLSSKLTATYALTQLVAFSAIMCAIIYVVTVHGFRLEDGLVAAVVRAVPQLYANISEIAKVFLKFQLADVSARRLMEYATEAEPDRGPAVPAAAAPAPIVFEQVRYSYAPGAQVQGGPDGISLGFAPASLNVVVGPSGSGKSMLSQLMMGRLRPVAGRILYGDSDIAALGQTRRSEIFSYMPQSIAIVTGTIEDNIRFGLPDSDLPGPGNGPAGAPEAEEASARMFEWIDRAAVGRFAREKSLDMPPFDFGPAPFAETIGALRVELRERVGKAAGVGLTPFASGALVPHLSVLENLTASAAHMHAVLPLGFSRRGIEAMARIAAIPGAGEIVEFGRHVIGRTLHLLVRCPSHDAYGELAPFRIEPPVWELRSRMAEVISVNPGEAGIVPELLLAGLTATPQEADAEAARAFADALSSGRLDAVRDAVRQHFAEALEPLDADRINPALNWRDNLLFGTPQVMNAPASRAVDQVLVEAVAATRFDGLLLMSGLQYQVGRKGRSLSGGQRQLISLCRTLLQGGPVLVFDEPTAALDPRHRGEINALLRAVARDHMVVAITHDAELARLADQVVMVKDGQVHGVGTYAELSQRSAEFRSLINSPEVATP